MSSPAHFEDIRKTIDAAFLAGFIASPGVLFVPTRFQNTPFEQPTAATWAEFWIIEGTSENADVSKDFQRTPGFIQLSIFTPEGAGSKKARECSDKLAEVFQNLDVAESWGQILFRAVSFRTIGKTREGWWQHNAICNFWVDVR